MGRNSDNTCGDAEPLGVRDKHTDYRMLEERGKCDRAHSSFEGKQVSSELDSDTLHDGRTDLNKLSWATNIARGIIDDKWW